MKWTKVEIEDELPDFETPVLVVVKPHPDCISAAMRVQGEDGWFWAQVEGYNPVLNDPDSYVFDDDYEYSHWMAMPESPEKQK